MFQALGIIELLGGGVNTAGWCYDGSKILYSSSPLALPDGIITKAGWQGEAEVELMGKAFADTKRQVAVTLKRTATLPAGERFASDDFGQLADDRKHLAVIDVCFKHAAMSVGLKVLGDALFDVRRQRAWAAIKQVGQEGIFELWKGKRQTIVMTAKGPMMQLDSAARVMLQVRE